MTRVRHTLLILISYKAICEVQQQLKIHQRGERRGRLSVKLGSLNNADAKVDAQSNMNSYFTSEIYDCIGVFGAPMPLKMCPG